MKTVTMRPLLWAIVGIAVGVFTVGMVYIAVTTNATAHAIREGQINNKSTFDLLQDCVVPDKDNECYTRGQKNQAGILNYVKIQQVAAVACGDKEGTQTADEINACVDRTMVKLGLPAPTE